jgi:soluble lytic murein transglycosylase-like protein
MALRLLSCPILVIGTLLASSPLACAGDRSATEFYTGDPATAGQVTDANLGKLPPVPLPAAAVPAPAPAAPAVPVPPPAAAVPAAVLPAAAVPAPAEKAKRTVSGKSVIAAAPSKVDPHAKAGRRLAAVIPPKPAAEAAKPPAAPAKAAAQPKAMSASGLAASDPTKAPAADPSVKPRPPGDRALTPADAKAAAAAADRVVVKTTEGPREGAAPTLADLVARHARENGIPLRLAEAVVTIESRGNSHAAHRGALGLMQIKPDTARSVGFNGGAAGLFEPEINLHYGMKLLGQAFKASAGDVCKALIRYQSGHLVTRMNAANRAYCGRARALMAGA